MALGSALFKKVSDKMGLDQEANTKAKKKAKKGEEEEEELETVVELDDPPTPSSL